MEYMRRARFPFLKKFAILRRGRAGSFTGGTRRTRLIKDNTMQQLTAAPTLIVQQKKEWAEILVDFESRNKYAVSHASGQQLYWAAEESSLLARMVLHALRPFKIHLFSMSGQPVMNIVKPFRFYFHEAEIYDAAGRLLGGVKREFSILTKKFTITDPSGGTLYDVCAPVLHPWTFKLSKNGAEDGAIVKQWSGLAKETFTDADNFSVTFPQDADTDKKAVLLGALFLIDMVYFENK